LYGFYGDELTNKYYLATVDLASGSYSILKEVPGLSAVYIMIFDSIHQQLIIAGVDSASYQRLYIADTRTGIIISQMLAPEIMDIQYNNNTGTLYGLVSKNGSGINMVTFDVAKGITSVISTLPGTLIGIYDGNITFDEVHNRYIINAGDTLGVSSLYSIDAATGNVIYKVPAPTTDNIDEDNIIQYRFDNVSGNLYALHWEAHTKRNTDSGSTNPPHPFIVYPNPVTGNGRIILDTVYSEVVFMLYDVLGRLVRMQKSSNASFINISKGGLASAVYFYKIAVNKKVIATGKLIVE